MFTEEDIKNASRVEPFTEVGAHILRGVMAEKRLPALVPAAVIFTLIFLTAPKGAVLQTTKSVIDSALSAWTGKTQPAGSPTQSSNVKINANNSNVQSIHVNSFGGEVNISPKIPSE